MESVPYDRPSPHPEHLVTSFLDAGHILGSASVDLRITEGARPPPRLLRRHRPRPACPSSATRSRRPAPIDTLIIESTYGNRDHESVTRTRRSASATCVRRAAGAAARCSFPRFAVGRTQELVYALHSLCDEREDPRAADLRRQPARGERHRGLPHAPGGLRRPGAAHREDPGALRLPAGELRARRRASRRRSTRCTAPRSSSRRSGMAEAGRILHHLAQRHRRSPRTSSCSSASRPSTRSGAGSRKGPRRCKIFGEHVPGGGRGRDHRRLLRPRRPRRAARLGPEDSAGPSGAPSWCTARTPPGKRWRRS